MDLTGIKYRGLIGTAQRPLTQKESEIFIAVNILGKNPTNLDIACTDMLQSFTYAIMIKRLEAFGVADKIDKSIAIFCSLLCKNPGAAVMWAYTINYILCEHGAPLQWEGWLTHFGNGVPTDEAYAGAWDAQKMRVIEPGSPGDNWIDCFDNWPRS